MRFVALRYFLETARHGSLRRASEVLHVAASAISRQIAILEESVGAPLFERVGSGMRLTQAGEIFATQARATLKDFERVQSDVDDLQQLRRGSIRISSMEGAVPGLLFRAMRRFSATYPGISFEVVVGGSEVQIGALVRSEVDLAIVFDPPPHPDVLVESAISDPVCAVMHPDHALAKKKAIQLRSLEEQRLAILDSTFVTRTLMDRAAIRDNVMLPPALTINHIAHAVAFARQGMGVTLAPRYVVKDDVDAGTLVAIPIRNPLLNGSRTALCRHRARSLSRAAEAFLSTLKDELEQLAVPVA